MEFQTDRLGTFVATVEPRVERVTVTDQGLLYNARLNKYISLRFPKKSVDRDTHIEIRVCIVYVELRNILVYALRLLKSC